MALEVHTVDLRARDGISPVLRQVSSSAQTMARDVDMAADTGRRGFERFSAAGMALGAALGTAGGLLSDFARAAAEEEVVFARLEQAVESTGRSYDEYGQAIERAIQRGEELAFADDQVAAGLATLTTQTGSAQTALDQIGLAMDVARARGIDLTTAATLVGKVHEGNIGILTRYGIAVEEGATATEALAILQQRTAGQADAYAQTSQGAFDRYRNSLDNLTESIGAHTGSLQTLLMMAPGLSAMYTTLAGLMGAIGGVGVLGAGALVAGSGVFAYDLLANGQRPGGSTSENALANIIGGAAGFLGFESIQAQYQSILTANDFEASAAFLQLPGQPTDTIRRNAELLLGLPVQADDLEETLINRAAALGMTPGQYLLSLAANNPNFSFDRATGAYVPTDVLNVANNNRYIAGGGQVGSGAFTMGFGALAAGAPDPLGTMRTATGAPRNPLAGEDQTGYTYAAYGSAGVAMGSLVTGKLPDGAQAEAAAASMARYRAELEATYPAFAGMVQGINSAHDAMSAFKGAQDGILADMGVFNQQASEYNQVLGSMESAYKILQERQAEGVALSREEQEFLKNYDTLYARVTGGVEDATVAQGLLAAQYAENMSKGDQLNDTLAGNTTATGELVDVIELLILSLDGVPEEVRSRILLDNAAETQASLSSIVNLLNNLDGRSATFYVNAEGNGVSVGRPNGPGITPLMMHGGMVEAAFTGRMTGSRYTLVGENGPEIVALPGGSLVTPAGASRAAMGGSGVTISGNTIYVMANDPMEFADAMRSRTLAEARY